MIACVSEGRSAGTFAHGIFLSARRDVGIYLKVEPKLAGGGVMY